MYLGALFSYCFIGVNGLKTFTNREFKMKRNEFERIDMTFSYSHSQHLDLFVHSVPFPTATYRFLREKTYGGIQNFKLKRIMLFAKEH